MAEKRVIWKPQPKQERALECPAFELFFGGAAGGGKTDFLLADFLDGVNYGSDHKGILFRKTYPEFEEIVARSRDLFPALGAVYNESKSKWTFPKGATIKFRALERDADVHKYQGHAYCVERSTKILMANGKYKAIDKIKIGDMVMTLEGKRKVTDVVLPYQAPCVKIGNQINPIWHPILTDSGWTSYASLLGIDSKEFDGEYLISDRLPPVNVFAKCVKRIYYQDKAVGIPKLYYDLCTFLQLSWNKGLKYFQLVSRKLYNLLRVLEVVLSKGGLFQVYVSSSDKTGSLQKSNWKSYYQFYRDLCDESLHYEEDIFLKNIQRLNGVAEHTRAYSYIDVQDNIPKHIQTLEHGFLHPYAGLVYPAEWESFLMALTISPCGYYEVCDITVDHANHYITNNGIVNKNTWVGWDELPNWSSSFCYIYMFSRCRSGTGVPCRIRATGNPGSPGHAWVKNRFINNQVPEQLFKDQQTGLTRCFIPSLLDDNLILMKNDPDYEKRLLLLPPHLQRALRFGDWDVFAGQAFEEFRYDQHVVHPFAIEPQWTRFTSMDWGYNKPYAILWWAITGDGRAVIYREMYGCLKDQPNTGTREAPLEVARKAWEISVAEGCKIMVADPACWSKISDSPSIAESFASAGWQMEKANNDRKSGLMTQHEFLKTTGADGKPMLLIFNTCYDLIRTLPEMVIDAAKPEDIDTTGEDHAVDSMRYGLMSRFIKSSPMYARHKAPKPMKYAKASRYSINTGLYERYK